MGIQRGHRALTEEEPGIVQGDGITGLDSLNLTSAGGLVGTFFSSCFRSCQKNGEAGWGFSTSVPILTSCPPLRGLGVGGWVLYVGFHRFAHRHKLLFKELNKCCYFHQIVVKVCLGKWLRF